MTAKEFLEQAFIAHQEIEARLEEITRLQSLATRTTSTLKSTPSSSGAVASKIEKAIADMQEKENRLTSSKIVYTSNSQYKHFSDKFQKIV